MSWLIWKYEKFHHLTKPRKYLKVIKETRIKNHNIRMNKMKIEHQMVLNMIEASAIMENEYE